ncbi:macrolide 2'-phosphotransferase [Paenibacillus sp. MER TA 81-3]|uniref:macrolide 2'-phosphotransferase n=1 Tax=Paenibacillus sp. MER TA 81-3 TaxID=2939573 RepID=UPI00203E6E05|nr:macrolide 2'-phosphotransferase [Paenibacillus sp. MER TA 81-3]MCM3337474.1 macrolide 2'-phosphotransferase [Paenibacillus sp. MER TA 81-3]
MTSAQSNRQNRIEEIVTTANYNGLRINANQVELNESGMDFLVAFATDDAGEPWVLRKPRRSDVLERAENEHKVLQLVREQLPIEVPDWRIFTPELIAYPLLRGKPIAMVDPGGGGYLWQFEQEALSDVFFDSFAGALAALHRTDQDTAAKAGVRIKSPQEARAEFSKNIDEIKGSFTIPKILQERWTAWLSDDSYWPGNSVLNHGDMHPPHIIVDETQRVTGFLDWTEAEVADPGKDFVIYYALFGEEGLRDLLARYEKAGGKLWPRMHEHIVEQWAAYPVLVAKFALITGQEADMEMARGMLANWNT